MEMVAMTKKAARSRSSLKYSGAPARERVGYTLCTFRERFARGLTLAKLAEIVDHLSHATSKFFCCVIDENRIRFRFD